MLASRSSEGPGLMPAYQEGNGRWRFRFAYNGKRYSGSTPKNGNTKRHAEQLERDYIDRLAKGVEELGPSPTIAAFVTTFLEFQAARTKPLTQRAQKMNIEVHIVPAIGPMKLIDVKKKHVDDLVSAWAKTGAMASTINTRIAVLQRLFSIAVERGVLVKSPDFEYMKVAKGSIRFLSELEAKTLIEAFTELDWRSMVFFGLRTGLRVGELRGLRWSDINLERGIVTVRRTDPGLHDMAATTPKSNADRHVPLTPDTIAMLRAYRAESGAVGHVWPARIGLTKIPQKARSAPGVERRFRETAAAAGLDDVTWHTLRHTYASWLVMRGVPLRVVQQYMGHHSITMTERYAHLAPEYGHLAVALLDSPLMPQFQPESQEATNALPDLSGFPNGPRRLAAGRA